MVLRYCPPFDDTLTQRADGNRDYADHDGDSFVEPMLCLPRAALNPSATLVPSPRPCRKHPYRAAGSCFRQQWSPSLRLRCFTLGLLPSRFRHASERRTPDVSVEAPGGLSIWYVVKGWLRGQDLNL
jgi:hypothetical protein